MIAATFLLALALDLTSIHQGVLADARTRSGADPDHVRVVHSERVTWRDGSLGCPEPGRMYTQALIPGYLIRVQADAAMLEYHASVRGQWLYCPAERAVAPAPDPST